MSTLSDRIKEALRRRGMRQADLVRATGASQPSVSDWMSGKTQTLRSPFDRKAAEALGVSVRWLNEGIGSPDLPVGEKIAAVGESETGEDFVAIPEYRIQFSAGPGCSEPTYEELEGEIKRHYLRSWFQSIHVNPEKCRRFTVHGDSMEQTLYDGDKILVECDRYKPIRSGHVYCFVVNGEDRVKRLFPLMTGGMIIRSDNPDYPEERMSAEEWEASAVLIGRVIDKSGSGGL